MADFDNRIIRGQAAEAGALDAGLRAYMLRVYNYMLVGLVLTGLTAYGVYSAATTVDPAGRSNSGSAATARYVRRPEKKRHNRYQR